MTLAANETSAYTQCSQPHRKLILTAMQLKFLQINLKIMAIQKIKKINILFKITLRALFAWRGSNHGGSSSGGYI